MKLKINNNQTRTGFLIIFAINTFLALFFLGQQYFFAYFNDKSFEFGDLLVYELIYFYFWGVLTPLLIWLANKFKIERKKLLKNLSVHFVMGMFVAIVHRMISMYLYFILIAPEKLKDSFPKRFSAKV